MSASYLLTITILDGKDIDVFTSAKLKEISANGAAFTVSVEERRIAANSVVMAVGYNPYAPLADALKDRKEVSILSVLPI